MISLRHRAGAMMTAFGCLTALTAGLAISTGTARAQVAFVAADAKWEALPKGGKFFGEGVVAAKDGKIYISDITAVPNPEENPGGTIYRFDPATGQTTKHLEPSGQSNGLHVDKSGGLVIGEYQGPKGGRRISRQDLATGKVTVLADKFDGKQLNGPNDVTSDAQGRIYFSDALYGASEPMELPNSVYRLDPDGKLNLLWVTGLVRLQQPTGAAAGEQTGQQEQEFDAWPAPSVVANDKADFRNTTGQERGRRLLNFLLLAWVGMGDG